MLGPEESLQLRIRDEGFEDASVDFGDGQTGPISSLVEHRYGTPGVYEVSVRGSVDGEEQSFEFRVVALESESFAGLGGDVIEPEGAGLISGVTPGLVMGTLDDARVAFGFATGESGTVGSENWFLADAGTEGVFSSQPVDAVVPVVNRSTEAIMTTLPIQGATCLQEENGGAIDFAGDIRSDDIVQAVVAIGGFEEMGARSLLASTLGYTPETLPESLRFVFRFGAE